MRQLDTLDDYLVKTTATTNSQPQDLHHHISSSSDDRSHRSKHDFRSSTGQVDELPEGWRQVLDKKKNKYFYVNT